LLVGRAVERPRGCRGGAAGGLRAIGEQDRDGFRVVLAGRAELLVPERLDVDRHRVHELPHLVIRAERGGGPTGLAPAEAAPQELHDEEDDDDQDDAPEAAADGDGKAAATEAAHPEPAQAASALTAAVLDLDRT